MTWASVAITGGSLIGGAMSKGDTQNISQQPMLTPEQIEAMKLMMNFGKTGSLGDYTAGAEYTGKLGNYELSDMENRGNDKIKDMMTRGLGLPDLNMPDMNQIGGIRDLNTPDTPTVTGAGKMGDMYNIGANTFKDFLSTDKFNPMADGGVYGTFKTGVMKELGEAKDRMKAQSAASGGVHSSAFGRGMGSLEEGATNQLTSKLANMYQDYANKKTDVAGQAISAGIQKGNYGINRANAMNTANLNAANFGLNAASAGVNRDVAAGNLGLNKADLAARNATTKADYGLKKNDAMMDLINNAQNIGMNERMLKDTEAKNAYTAWLNKRSELKDRINAISGVAGQNVPYGAKSMQVTTPSPWSNLFNSGLDIGSDMLGKYYQSKI